MRTSLYLIGLVILTSSFCCNAQQQLTLQYIGRKASATQNTSFINNTFLFLNKKDTLFANVKVPFDTANPKIINKGIYYNCLLKEGNSYTISIKKINKNDIPEGTNSYYKINAVFNDRENSAKFIEVKKDTKYLYNGYYERYVDVDNVLYEIVGISPDGDCFYPH
ncbi:MAG: hypothetical protein WC756_15520 [Taibaiella sp.]|jgi:hypothetical protein